MPGLARSQGRGRCAVAPRALTPGQVGQALGICSEAKAKDGHTSSADAVNVLKGDVALRARLKSICLQLAQAQSEHVLYTFLC